MDVLEGRIPVDAAGGDVLGQRGQATDELVDPLLGYHFSLAEKIVPDWWPDFFAVASNLLLGALVSFLFYYLVVFIPERQKRCIIKANLKTVYRNVKEDILWEIIQASIKGGRKDQILALKRINAL